MSAHVQVAMTGTEIPESLLPALKRLGATVSFGPIEQALRHGPRPSSDALIVIQPDGTELADSKLQVLLRRLAVRPCGTLVLTPGPGPEGSPSPNSDLPVTYAGRISVEEMAGRIASLVGLRRTLRSVPVPSRRNSRA
jgi:hypothetical protein